MYALLLQICFRFDHDTTAENTTIRNVAILFDFRVLTDNRKLYNTVVFNLDTAKKVRVFNDDVTANCTIFSNNTFSDAGVAAQFRVRPDNGVVADDAGEGQLQVFAEVDVAITSTVLVDDLGDLRITPAVQDVVGDLLIGRPVGHLVDVPVVHNVRVQRAVEDLFVDQQPLDEVVFGLEVEVVGEQARNGRGTDGHVRFKQVAPHLDGRIAAQHQIQGQADLAAALAVVQHAAGVRAQHQCLAAAGAGVAALVDQRHHGAAVPFAQGLEPSDHGQQGQLADHVAPEQHEIVADQRARVHVSEHVAEREARVRAGVDDVQPTGAGVGADVRLDAVRGTARAEHHHVRDAGRLEQVQRVVQQRLVDQRHQARVVPVRGRPEVLVEETGHHHGLHGVLFLHPARGAARFARHGRRRRRVDEGVRAGGTVTNRRWTRNAAERPSAARGPRDVRPLKCRTVWD